MTPLEAVAEILDREFSIAVGDEEDFIAELDALGFVIVPKVSIAPSSRKGGHD